MSWNSCTYITQSDSTDVRNHHYETACSQCVGELNMSSSIYIAEDSEFKLYINSGTQSGSLIHTSSPYDSEEDDGELGTYENGMFCPKCKGFFVQESRDNMMYRNHELTSLYISHSQYLEYSASNCDNEESRSIIENFYPEREQNQVFVLGWGGITGSLKDDGSYTMDDSTLMLLSSSVVPVSTQTSESGSVNPWAVQFWTD